MIFKDTFGLVVRTARRLFVDFWRVAALALLGYAFMELSVPLALALNIPFIATQGLWLAAGCWLMAAWHVQRRLAMPTLDFIGTVRTAIAQNQAGLAAIALAIMSGCILLALVLMPSASRAGELPAGARLYLPVLAQQVEAYWPGADVATMAGQTEQETCPSLSHRMCWNPRAELKTAREQGVGLGQCTRTARFDCIAEQRARWPKELAGWSWDSQTLYDPVLQLRALVLMDRANYERVLGAANEAERWAMTLVKYNAGPGRVDSNRRLCAGTKGCNPARWFDHAEHTTTLPCVRQAGYGKCFRDIMQEYPRHILLVRRDKYVGAV